MRSKSLLSLFLILLCCSSISYAQTYSAWSSTAQATTFNCNQPTNLTTSVNGSDVTFNWEVPNGTYSKYILKYRLLNSTANQTVVEVNASSSTAVSQIVNGLSDGTYIWNVRGDCGSDGTTTTSFGVNFIVSSVPCGSPTLNSVNVTGSDATLSWNAPDATVTTSYEYAYRNLTSGSWVFVTTTETSVNVSLSDGTYVWRVRRVCDNGVVTNWAYGSSFIIQSIPCGSPTLNSVIVSGSDATLSWSAPDATVTTSYEYAYRNLPSGSWVFVTTTQTSVNVNLSDGVYIWRVRRVCDNGVVTNWTYGTSSFSVESVTCGSPVLGVPSIVGSEATLSWSAPDATTTTSYEYAYFLTSGSSWVFTPTVQSSVSVTLANGRYNWRVRRTCDTGLTTPWSYGGYFTINSGGIRNSDFISNGNGEVRVYPNPSNGIVTVENNIKLGSILVYSSTGQMVMQKSIQESTTSFDLSSFGKGMYLIKISNQEGVHTKKVVIR